MNIVDVKAIPLAVNARRSAGDVPWVWGRLSQVFIEVKTEDGLVGWGEAFAYGVAQASAAVIRHTLRPLLIGEDARRIREVTRKLFQQTHLGGRHGITTFAISGVEIALWDLAGKRANKPLYELLGGASSRHIPAYASLVRYPEGHARIRADARKAVDEGYAMVKLHQVTPESVAMARDVIGPEVPLTLDVNCAWSPLEAVRMARAMEPCGLYWLEEPVWPPEDFDGLARVQAATGVPLAAGENACTAHPFKSMMDAGAVSFVQPSVIKVGGIAEWLKVAHLAEVAGYEMAPHSPYFGPGFAATLQLIAHTGQPRWVEKIYFDLEAELFTQPLAFSNAVYTVPDGPGLGVEPDPEVLEAFRLED